MTFWLILLFSFFFIRYVLPLVLRTVLSGFVRKQMRNGGFGPGGPQAGSPPGPGYRASANRPAQQPGEVRVDFVPPAPASSKSNPTGFKGGEYVDYEEVK